MQKTATLFLLLIASVAFGQKDTTKQYCTFLADGQSPTKLFSIGYDYIAPHRIGPSIKYAPSTEDYEGKKVTFNGGLRIGGNLPVVNKKRWSLNIGYAFRRSSYWIKETTPFGNNYFDNLYFRINQRGLSTVSLNTSLFVPLNNRHFILGFAQGEISGDYNFKEFWKRFTTVRGSYSLMFGWKKKPNKTIGVGVARTWRGGTAFYNPVLLWNQTFNKHWGMELLLPARGFVRYNFSQHSLLLLGYELEGSSYNMGFNYTDNNQVLYNSNFELRRSELRPRITWEKSIYKFIWFSAQAGVRINYRNKLAFDNNQPRGEYVLVNKLPATFYCMATINLVIPPK